MGNLSRSSIRRRRWGLACVLALLGANACSGSGTGDSAKRTPDGGSAGELGSDASSVTGGSGGKASGKGGKPNASGTGGSSARTDGGSASGSGAGGGDDAATGNAGGDSGAGSPSLGPAVTVHLVPQSGVSGSQRINFAVPLQPGQLDDASQVRVLRGSDELSAGRRALATYAGGSARSVQLQFDLDMSGETDVDVHIGEAPTTDELDLMPVSATLVAENGEQGPRVWALLPAAWLSASGVLGPLVPEADVANQPTAAWASLCDYDMWNTAAFMDAGYETDRAVWLFDRGTAMYRGYARRGDLSPLQSAYVETAMYRNRITGTGTDARNGIPPDGAEDVKYTYSQNLALHYLLTGDDRFRESAEDMALALSVLWPDPGYAGGSDFWTERHAGFGLLGFVWAMIVSDDRSADFRALADADVDAYLEMQASYPPDYTDKDARCFAHTADAHGESGSYFGCSPWMSAILGDGLEQYARESDAARAADVRESLVELGRIIATRGIQSDGRPYYFMGVGTDQNMTDEYDEHYGESAYLIAMAWYFSGRSDSGLRDAADMLVSAWAPTATLRMCAASTGNAGAPSRARGSCNDAARFDDWWVSGMHFVDREPRAPPARTACTTEEDSCHVLHVAVSRSSCACRFSAAASNAPRPRQPRRPPPARAASRPS